MNTSIDANLLTFEQVLTTQMAKEEAHWQSTRVLEENKKEVAQAVSKHKKHFDELITARPAIIEQITILELREAILQKALKQKKKNRGKIDTYEQELKEFVQCACSNYKNLLQRQERRTASGKLIARDKKTIEGLVTRYNQHTIQPVIVSEKQFIQTNFSKSSKKLTRLLADKKNEIAALDEQETLIFNQIKTINEEVENLKRLPENCRIDRTWQIREKRDNSIYKNILDGNRSAVRKKLAKNPGFNLVNQFAQGFFTLNLAMQEGRLIIALMLLLRGADPSLKDINQMTALDYCHDTPSVLSILTQVAIKNSLPNTRFPKNTVNEQNLIERYFDLHENDTLGALYTMKLEHKLKQLQLRYFKKKSTLSFTAWLEKSYGNAAIVENEVYRDFQRYIASFVINDGVNRHTVNNKVFITASSQMKSLLNKYAKRFYMFNNLDKKPGTINNLKGKTSALKQTLKQDQAKINKLDDERIKQEKHFNSTLHLSKINGLIHTSNIFLTPEQMNQHIQCLEKYSTYRNPKKLKTYLQQLENKHNITAKTLIKTLPDLIKIAAKHHRSRTVRLLACLGWPTTTASKKQKKLTVKTFFTAACHLFSKKHRQEHSEPNKKNATQYTFKNNRIR